MLRQFRWAIEWSTAGELFICPENDEPAGDFWRVSAAFAGLSGMLQHIVLHIGCIFYHQLLCLTTAKKRGLGLILNKLCTVNYKDCVGGNGGFKCW